MSHLKCLMILCLCLGAFSSQAQPAYDKTAKKLDKVIAPYGYGKNKITLEPGSKDFIPVQHFKTYFSDKADKISYEKMVTDTIDIFGKPHPCVKQFTLIKFEPDPCKEDPFKVSSIEPLILFYNEIFPSFICGITTNVPASAGPVEKFFSDKSGSIGFRFASRCTNKKVYYEINSNDGYFRQVLKGHFYTSSGKVEIFPDIPWNYDKLLCNRERRQGSVSFRFYDDQGQEYNKTETVYYRSANDCMLSADLSPMGYSFSSRISMRWMPLAYVNEESQEINRVMAEIVRLNPQVPAWGFAAGTDGALEMQVEAVWKYLQSKDIKYNSITDNPDGAVSYIWTQNIRHTEASLSDKSANCIDGSVLFASMLRKWGFPCYLVLVPGHAFLAYDIQVTDQQTGKVVIRRRYLETTMVGGTNEKGEKNTMFDALLTGLYEAEITYKGKTELYELEAYRTFVKPIPIGACAR